MSGDEWDDDEGDMAANFEAEEVRIKRLAQKHGERAIETLRDVMDDVEANENAKVNAAKAILDRGFGQPSRKIEQKVDVTVVDTRRAHLDAMRQVAAKPPTRPLLPPSNVIDAEFTEIEKGK